jgi:hypothetical protein
MTSNTHQKTDLRQTDLRPATALTLARLIVALIGVFLCLGLTGCMSEQDYIAQRQSQILKIQNNPALTPQQKNNQIMAIANEPLPQPPYLLYALAGSAGIAALIGLLKWEQGRKPKPAAVAGVGAYAPNIDEKPAKVAKPKKNKSKVTIYNDPLPAPKPAFPPPVQAVEPPMPDIVEKVHIPISQAEVDEIPEEELGMSFFTSRPMPQEALVEVTILIGGLARIIRSTKEESIECRINNTPKVRAFDIDGTLVPWYDIPTYDPYDHYWDMVNGRWLPDGDEVTATFIKAANLDPRMTGYYGVPMVENILPDSEDELSDGEDEIEIPEDFDYDTFAKAFRAPVYTRPKGWKRTHVGDPFIVRRRREPTPRSQSRTIARGAWRAAAKAFHQMPGVSPETDGVEEPLSLGKTRISRKNPKPPIPGRYKGRRGLRFKRRTKRDSNEQSEVELPYADI